MSDGNDEGQMVGRYEYHPIANLFPLIEGKEYQDLVEHVRKNGVLHPILLYEGKILDGRNRYRAAMDVGIECPTTEYAGLDAVAIVIGMNLHRRHLNDSQRGMIAAKLANMVVGGKETNSANLLNCQSVSQPVSQSDAAGMLQVSTRMVTSAAKVQAEAPQEVVKAVEAGEVSINLATQFAELPEEVKREALAAIAEQSDVAKEVIREAVKAHVAHNSGNNEWYTPVKYIELARQVMGGIDCDPATSELANETVKAETIFTAEDDGREQTWHGRVWMNPPYAQPLMGDFAEAVSAKFESLWVNSPPLGA